MTSVTLCALKLSQLNANILQGLISGIPIPFQNIMYPQSVSRMVPMGSEEQNGLLELVLLVFRVGPPLGQLGTKTSSEKLVNF